MEEKACRWFEIVDPNEAGAVEALLRELIVEKLMELDLEEDASEGGGPR